MPKRKARKVIPLDNFSVRVIPRAQYEQGKYYWRVCEKPTEKLKKEIGTPMTDLSPSQVYYTGIQSKAIYKKVSYHGGENKWMVKEWYLSDGTRTFDSKKAFDDHKGSLIT